MCPCTSDPPGCFYYEMNRTRGQMYVDTWKYEIAYSTAVGLENIKSIIHAIMN